MIKKLIEYQKLHRIHTLTIWSLENFKNVRKFDLLKNITCFIIYKFYHTKFYNKLDTKMLNDNIFFEVQTYVLNVRNKIKRVKL